MVHILRLDEMVAYNNSSDDYSKNKTQQILNNMPKTDIQNIMKTCDDAMANDMFYTLGEIKEFVADNFYIIDKYWRSSYPINKPHTVKIIRDAVNGEYVGNARWLCYVYNTWNEWFLYDSKTNKTYKGHSDANTVKTVEKNTENSFLTSKRNIIDIDELIKNPSNKIYFNNELEDFVKKVKEFCYDFTNMVKPIIDNNQ